MAGISSKAFKPNYVENRKKYNGIDFEGDIGLGIYDAHLRELDPQKGLWWEIGGKVDNMEMWTPYASNYNNPIKYSDPLGDEGQACCQLLKEIWKEIKYSSIETAKSVYQGANDVARVINVNINPLTPVVEFITGRSVESDFTESKPRMEAAGPALVSSMPVLRGPLTKLAESAAVSVEQKVVPQVTKNAAQGEAYEKVVTQELKQAGHTNIAGQVTIKPNGASGKVRIDVVSKSNGNIVLTEAKSSEAAMLTRNQKIGYPILEQKGGVVVGNKGASEG